jgi:polysaccharide biosynthesis transport protein
MDLFGRRLATVDDLPRGLPLLGSVPRPRDSTPEALLEGSHAPPLVDGFRRIRAALAATGKDSDFPRTIVVASPDSEKAGTLVATHLALALAAAGIKVALVDAAMRANAIARAFGVRPDESDLADALSGRRDAASCLVSVSNDDVSLGLLVPGEEAPIDLVVPERVHKLLRQLQPAAEVVVINAPAFSYSADALTWAVAAESVIVAIRLDGTPRDQLEKLLDSLEHRSVRPSGVVAITRKRVRTPPDQRRLWSVNEQPATPLPVDAPLRPAAGSKRLS